MIRFKSGNILAEDAEALVNTVNCVGVMGRGIALQFKNAYPANFAAYADACRQGDVVPGRVFVHENDQITNPRYIINFPTKRHWRASSRIDDIDAGLIDLTRVLRDLDIRSIAIPPLGCGLGGLDWALVRPRIERALQSMPDLDATIFEPDGAPDPRNMAPPPRRPRMTTGRAALVGLLDTYLDGLLDPTVSLLELHKLMYFMQVAGEPLRLEFVEGDYGPYAHNLRHVLQAIEGHFVTGYADGGDAPGKPLQLLPGAVAKSRDVLRRADDTRLRLRQVAHLVSGFESSFGLELLATVHWVLAHHRCESAHDLVACVHAWNPRKRQFSSRQIQLAETVLAERSFLS